MFALPPRWLGALCFIVCGTACAGSVQRPDDKPQPRAGSATCTKGSQAEANPAFADKLAAASDVLSFETAWKLEHPSAVAGSVSRSEVLKVIRGHSDEIRGCYEAGLASLPDNSRGQVVVRFVIDQAGQVPLATLAANELGVPEVACCLAQHVAQWSFPAPTGGDFVVVEYPFSVQISRS
jgi:hypothetical protein